MRSGGGEIVEVQGGHIVRSTGRKDRHSKVCTAKGPRDRRVRLSAHTAIQFYDVQDRLGYDRPSKAVDWLIKKAKAAIDELAELPAWNPNTCVLNSSGQQRNQQLQEQQMKENDDSVGVHRAPADAIASSSRRTTSLVGSAGGGRIPEHGVRNVQQQLGENPNSSSSFLPPSLDTDIADTIKSFFPMGAISETTSTSIQFQSYPPDLLSRTSSQNQDLRLSLQSFQDPILQLHRAQHHHQTQNHHQNQEVLFSATTPLGFDGTSSTGWSEQYQSEEHGRFQRMVAWNAGADTGNSGQATAVGGGGGGVGGFMFSSLPPAPTPLPPFFGQNQYLSQRGPLQSSNTPSIRAWIDPSVATATIADHHHHYLPPTIQHHPSSLSGIGFATSGGFSGFRIPARLQGEEEHDGVSDKPSSASSDSRH